jgi:hypothetical protein
MRVYTYYMPIGLYDEYSQRKLIEVWARSWSKFGWEPIVLNEGDAQQHPWYWDYKAHVWNLPTEYGHDYEGSCFLRWLAMAAQATDGGGGMMTDYDVINYGLSPMPPDPNKMKIFCEPPPIPVDMGAVLGTKKHYEEICKIHMGWKPHPIHDWNNSAKLLHCSDLSLMVRMFENGNFPKPEWLVKTFGYSGRFPRPSYKTARLVHYGYDMKLAGHWPKWTWIERLRPF